MVRLIVHGDELIKGRLFELIGSRLHIRDQIDTSPAAPMLCPSGNPLEPLGHLSKGSIRIIGGCDPAVPNATRARDRIDRRRLIPGGAVAAERGGRETFEREDDQWA